jgi:hypothetical protein
MQQFVVVLLTVFAAFSSVWANLGDSGDPPARKATAWQAK